MVEAGSVYHVWLETPEISDVQLLLHEQRLSDDAFVPEELLELELRPFVRLDDLVRVFLLY